MDVIAVKAPGLSADDRRSAMDDLAVLTGGTPLLQAAGDQLHKVSLANFGKARRISANLHNLMIVGGKGDTRQLRKHIAALRSAYTNSQDANIRKKLLERIGKLLGGSATLWVGDTSPVAVEARKELAEHTAEALRGAMRAGVVPGGGMALLACRPALQARLRQAEEDEQQAAYSILLKALESPARVILENAGLDSRDVLAEVRQAGRGGDGKDEWVSGIRETPDYGVLSPDELKKMVQDAGIVGMGGATFPTHVKLSPPKEKPVDVVILKGAECEPYLTSDHRLMLEKPKEIIEGLKILMKILNVKKGYVGIEANKPDAVEAMKKAVAGSPEVQVWPVMVKYPPGAEKMLIKAIAGRTVPAGGLPMDRGVVVQNVGTAAAIYDAVRYGRPLIERYVTGTGRGVKDPKNFLARIGTPFSQLIEEAGGMTEAAAKVISGGPMMGMSQYTLDVPVIKGTSGITVLTAATSAGARPSTSTRCWKDSEPWASSASCSRSGS